MEAERNRGQHAALLCGLASDADTWIVPAEALWRALHHANALDTYGLD